MTADDLPAWLRADLLDLVAAHIEDNDPDPWTADHLHGQARQIRREHDLPPVSPWSLP